MKAFLEGALHTPKKKSIRVVHHIMLDASISKSKQLGDREKKNLGD